MPAYAGCGRLPSKRSLQRKKTAEIIRQEISRELEHLLQLLFSEQRNRGGLDLEAVEMAIRSAMHQAGASTLSRLSFEAPGQEQRQLPCSCGHMARYVELRGKPVLRAVGKAECIRPCYLCEHCHRGQFPVDVDLDIENTELSPGVRRTLTAGRP
jgi:hypothetical protein